MVNSYFVRVRKCRVPRPSLVCPVNNGRDDGDIRLAPIQNEHHAGGNFAYSTIIAPRPLWKDVQNVPFIEDIDSHSDSTQIRRSAFDREGIPEFEKIGQKAAFEEGVACHVVKLS